MTAPTPTEQELIVHVFAPLEGRRAAHAFGQVRSIWQRCRDLLGVTDPISATGLPTAPPAVVHPGPDGPLAAAQNEAVDIQLLLRRHQDMLNLSLAFAAPVDAGPASFVPPGWIEFDRWWVEVVGDDTDALLGTARVHQAKPPGEWARERLPARLHGRIRWGSPQSLEGDILLWEPDPSSGPDRDLVVMAPVGEDDRLSAWTWSRGEVDMPPLARYLANAAKLRHHIRVWERDEAWLARLRTQVDTRVDELRTDLTRADVVGELRGDEIGLAVAADRVERMRESVAAVRHNMALLMSRQLDADVALVDWFHVQLGDTLSQLDRSRGLARVIREMAPAPEPVRAAPKAAGKRFRMGFMLDVVDYGSRSTPAEERVQERLAVLVKDAVTDLGLDFADADHQGAGDGLLVFLPDHVDVQRALPSLLNGMARRVADDNAVHRDRIRLRMAADVGPVGLAALGFGGKVTLTIGRLLDSRPLRAAVVERPGADLVVMLSDRLHEYVVGEGVLGLDPDEFEPAEIAVKTFTGRGWLWKGR
ncbi:CATRA conflict system CASPASE/TPR repeat-associated protein [Saccharothrix deserti]|uniref:CATRA conflict system CASPASE/TPR repeat-associated protein n=1 Tax=Saccharothrix deserti TaxID=2593674 RepID=UPI00131BC7CF|nr:CATRA conflict system CASPASE/TPR repeat-associated protein [Saccharothrix deserti]